MSMIRPSTWSLAACIAAATPFAFAQVNPATSPTVQHGPAGIEYLNGGSGEEERAAMAARQPEFPFRVVMSAAGGQFIVADTLSVATPQGELLAIRDAGPIVMIKLPPGSYNLEATWQGRTERRSVRLATSAQTLEWRFPG